MKDREPFVATLTNLIEAEFPGEKLTSLVKMDNALTAVVYAVNFESVSYIAKIGYDEREIAMGKGDREKRALELANEILGTKMSPKLVRYYKNYPGFPGYVTFIEKLYGNVLPPEVFNKVASTDINIVLMVDMLMKLHSHRDKNFSELTPGSSNDISEYFASRFNRIKTAMEEAKLSDEMAREISLLPGVFDYFRGYTNNSFIHGDINFKNVLIQNNEITSLIDWDRALIAPIGFEFAQVSTLTEKYGVSGWHKKLRESYFNTYDGDGVLLQKEFELIEYFVYFLLLARKLTHASQRDLTEICVETGEEFKDHLIRKIKEYKLPRI